MCICERLEFEWIVVDEIYAGFDYLGYLNYCEIESIVLYKFG